MPRGLRHVALSISCLSPMARRPEALLAMNMASLIFRPDLGFLALTSFQSFNRPSLSSGSSPRISLSRQSFSVSRSRLRPPGNIHNRSRLLLTNKTRPRFAATSFDDFAITVPHRPNIESFARFYKILDAIGCMLRRGMTWLIRRWVLLRGPTMEKLASPRSDDPAQKNPATSGALFR